MEKPWSKEETIIAFNVYCKIPFKDSRKTNPLVVKYVRLLGRSPSALNMKIGNIGRLDPELRRRGITGLAHGAKLEEEVWNEFCTNPDEFAFESERLLAKLSGASVESLAGADTADLPVGKERMAVVRQRVNQSFFREAVVSAYGFRCCISGVGCKELLEACHIVGWSQDVRNRVNPSNGLCLNPFFHKAYDNLLVSITPEYRIVVSDELIEKTHEASFKSYLYGLDGQKIALPDKFYPGKDFLAAQYHRFVNK